MPNRTEMLRRIKECGRRGVPTANDGNAISKLQGVLPRIMKRISLKGGGRRNVFGVPLAGKTSNLYG